MDHLFEIDNIKTEKDNAMRKFRRIKNIATLFRLVEICLVLMFISWVSTNHLPDMFKCFGEHLHNFSVFVAKPKIVFLVGNAIILTLFAKSGGNNSSSPSSSISNGFSEASNHHHLYDEFIKKSNKNGAVISKTKPVVIEEEEEEEIVFQEKEEIVFQEQVGDVLIRNPVAEITTTSGYVDLMDSVNRNYRSSKSENSKNHGVYEKQSSRKLRRSETEKYRNVAERNKVFSCEDAEMMSNDELRKKVEDFIAKQTRFHIEESMKIILPKNQILLRDSN